MSSRDHLCVNDFLSTELDARAIASALELGVIDLMLRGPCSLAKLSAERRLSQRGLLLLVDMLEANGVVSRRDDDVDLTAGFRAALRFRDLLEARIAFADRVWPDIHALFTPLLNDLPQFMARSKTFELFRYDRCFEVTEENLAATRKWTIFTTCLTKYESGAALDAIDLGGVRNFIDLGGNTGEFALQLCRRNSAVQATVVDLPVVCELGRRHIAEAGKPLEAARIAFFPTDMRTGALPPPADLVSFKSVLHDWPEEDARRLIERAAALVRPGGRIMIFEREPIDVRGRRIPYALAPDLVFLHFPRTADLYLRTLHGLGFSAIERHRVALDVGFHLILARRPGV